MGERTNMGNCLPLLFPNLLRSDDHSPLEEVIDTTSGSSTMMRHPDSEVQSVYTNELWNNERRRQELSMKDPKKAHVSALLEQIPADTYKIEAKMRDIECPICMGDFVDGDLIRYLPCMHCYHKDCVDEWLMRSFSCPSCMEPVDSAMLSSFATHTLRGLETLACSPATSGIHHSLPPT
ncbi:Nedd4 WW domain-binding protein 2 [Loa loa]|uniref:Nedd4 WW domain-binding protein 2 n=1 Tax=Loa loa TaxID=7209 RepID=A0A1S0TQB9_LOALO|nr:Nedd4 WW domain-binding protein 2 [Loa loa]EFO18326.1 Nedd4 WW domain-binding protein 2 [Loa loa]